MESGFEGGPKISKKTGCQKLTIMSVLKHDIADQLGSEDLYLSFGHPLLPGMPILIQPESVEKNSREAGKSAPFLPGFVYRQICQITTTWVKLISQTGWILK